MKGYVSYFSDPLDGPVDAKQLLGGKGASLKEMTRAQLRVPPGFTVITDACAAYLQAGRTWPDGLKQQVGENLARLEQESGRKFGQGASPLLVSVRSGAARSMPGMMDTLLNCGLHPGLAEQLGDTETFWSLWCQFVLHYAAVVDDLSTETFRGVLEADLPGRDRSEALLAAYRQQTGKDMPTDPHEILDACITAVFDSWNNQRAIDYRNRHDIRGLKGTAVNVQMMWPSEVSGIVFTHDPTDIEAERMVIEASYGLGEAVVSGDVTPDRYIVSRNDPTDVEVHIGDKAGVVLALGRQIQCDPQAACLDSDQLAELVELSKRVETHFGHPVDIEWGLADGTFALLQARAIRGLDIARDVELGRQEEIQRLKDLAGGKRKVWVAHNLGETLPAPTPMTWQITREYMTGEGGFGQLYQMLGYRPSQQVRQEGFLELICGRIYADPDRLAGLFWDGMPMSYDLDLIAEDESLLNQPPTRFSPEQADGRFLLNLPANLAGMIRSARRTKRLTAVADTRFQQEILPDYLAWVETQHRMDLSQLSDAQLLEELDSRRRKVLTQFAPESLLPGFCGGMALARLDALLSQLLGPQQGPALAATLTMGLEGDKTVEQDHLLYDIAQGRQGVEVFIERYGHRCIGEMELSRPRYREDRNAVEKMLARLAGTATPDPRKRHQENIARRNQADADLFQTLAEAGAGSFEKQVRTQLDRARRLLPYRETGKYYLMMGYELIRNVLEEFDTRYQLAGGVYYLLPEQLSELADNKAELLQQIEQRRVRHSSAQRLDPAEVIDSRELEDLGKRPRVAGGSEMQGTAVAPGSRTGPARIVLDPSSAGELGTGYILVCPSTDPGWTPLFLNAAGLIVERGGVLSHGAIVARDFGIPAVVLPGATRMIQDGQQLQIDGDAGKVLATAVAEGSTAPQEAQVHA
ncbi:MAG: PEP/pyruvate-binding domain-containing protein [Phycisphaerae bacterium]